MIMQNDLVLRDIHTPAAPSLWPPAPGWWIVAALLLVATVLALWWWRRRRQRRLAIIGLFDAAVADAPTAVARVAAISELLRRASRRRDAHADRLEGDAWLRFLDGDTTTDRAGAGTFFSQGPGRVLLDGGFRREIGQADVDALLRGARSRYLEWMAAGR